MIFHLKLLQICSFLLVQITNILKIWRWWRTNNLWPHGTSSAYLISSCIFPFFWNSLYINGNLRCGQSSVRSGYMLQIEWMWMIVKKGPLLQGYRSDPSIMHEREKTGMFHGHKNKNVQPEPVQFVVKWNAANKPQDFLNASIMLKSEHQMSLRSSYITLDLLYLFYC